MGWQGGEPDWGKKCCSNEAGPVKQPPDNLNKDQLEKVSIHWCIFLQNLKFPIQTTPSYKFLWYLVVKLSGFPKCLYKGGGDIFVSEYLPVVSIEFNEKNQNLQ